jgi:acetylornithine deacetylase
MPGRVEVGEPEVVAGMRSPRGTALEAALLATVGGTASSGAPFATDGGELERAGVASLICGPGELEQAHQPNESMPRGAFEDGVGVIQAVVTKLCRA